MEAVRLIKEKQIYNADEKWVNVPVGCFVSIASVGIFLDSSHSLPCNPFYFLFNRRALAMFNYEEKS